MRTMFSIFGRYHSLGPIELNATIIRYVDAICISMLRPKMIDEIIAYMFKAKEEIASLFDL